MIAIRHTDPKTYPSALAEQLQGLMHALRMQPSLVISHLKIDMLNYKQQNNEPINTISKKALQILPPSGFENALAIEAGDLRLLVEQFYALVRSNSLAPEYIFFCDPDDTFAFFLCPYGNVHTIEFGEEVLYPRVLREAKWYEVKSRCYDKFSV